MIRQAQDWNDNHITKSIFISLYKCSTGGNMEFKQSQTYQNIQNMFMRKLMTSTLFDIYSDKARQETYIQISNIFTSAARNEKEHARIFLRKLNNEVIPDTQTNLYDSINIGTETNALCRSYAATAKEEGYPDIAALLNGIANIELNHNLDFRTQYDNIIQQQVFCKPTQSIWICLQCGNILVGDCAPQRCPICGFPQGYYQIYDAQS